MHPVLDRQLKRADLGQGRPPADGAVWAALLDAIGRTYEQADQDRYLLERSLSLSSAEMGDLHAQLAAERDFINTVLCSLVEGVCALDNAGAVLLINPAARRLFRISDEEAVEGKPLSSFVNASTADGSDLSDILSDTDRVRRSSGQEPRLIINGEANDFITFTISPLGPGADGVVLTLRDVTEAKRLESERNELNRRLVEISRQAGMAEVASDVLHNVGNVLNSVNTSVSVTHQAVKSSHCGAVARLAELLSNNRERLAEFLTEDPAGSKIPEYLAHLGGHLGEERERVLSELDALRKSVDHIREIIAAQQSYAKIGGVREPEDMAAMTEEAIRVVATSLSRHAVEIIRDFQPTPPVLVERNQVLQVLVNLLTNAKQSVTETHGDRRRTITVRIETADDNAVQVRISDTGCGIPRENLTRIFAHGFTTRRSGHGFGLHSAANAAKAMGGSLNAASEGVDRGACFTLRIPIGPPQMEKAA